MWPAHKLACGPGKALPFATKPLERSELDIAEKRLDEVALPFQPGAKSLRKKLLGFGPVASAEVRRAGCPTGSERACVLTLSPLALAERAR